MDLEATFQHFCRTREPASLGAVFDACADDLFGLALHLTGHRAMAEDALQATFLVAIERAHHWQATRPLRPWLLGILHREVKRARRRARRVPDATRVPPKRGDTPEGSVLAAEVLHAVQQALGEMPEPYRAVLDLHLVQALPPAEVAARLRRSPGSVRTQLWRGLEMLRQRLPHGLAIGLGVHAMGQDPLAVVREHVLARATASSALPTLVTGLVLGGLMKKLVAIAALLVLGLVAWQLPALQSRSPFNTAPTSTPLAEKAPLARDAGANATEDTVRTPAVAAAPAPNSPSPLRSIEVAVRVLDLAGADIADAEIEVFAPSEPRGANGELVVPEARELTTLQQRVTTDAHGRARLTLHGPSLLSARKARIGWSGDRIVRAGTMRMPDELLLVLQPTGTLRGVVLGVDGSPVAGAKVTAQSGLSSMDIAGLAAVHTDGEGRFTLEGVVGREWLWDYHLRASLGTQYTADVRVAFAADAVRDVVLRFPGAFAVRGVLVDAGGAPCAGELRLRGKPGTATVEEWARAQCGDDGRFELQLTHPGSYWLAGGRQDRTPALIAIELSEERPQATVELRLQPLVTVTGRVLDEAGHGLAGRSVAVQPDALSPTTESSDDEAHRMRLLSEVGDVSRRGTSDGAGRFRIEVPVGWRTRALTAAIPGNRELWASSAAFTPPADDVAIVVRASDATGFFLAGTVVADADGTPIANVGIERIHVYRSGSGSAHEVGRARDGTFRIGPLANQGRSTFVFSAEGFARTEIGPFDLGPHTQEIAVRMLRCGSVRVRVLRADGTPAASAFVVLQRERGREDPFAPSWQGATDRTGERTFAEVEPLALTVLAWPSNDASIAGLAPASTPVLVRPGQEPVVVVQFAH